MSIAWPAPQSRSFSFPWRRTAAATRLERHRDGLAVSLGLVWLLDAALQFQPFMFSKSFVTQITEPTAAGNPAMVARPLTWAAHLMVHHIVLYNSFFAMIQLLLALAILYPATRKFGLAASIPWAVGVWWFGEGLGGILTSPTSDPFTGAPGAVILYAYIALLVWPRDREPIGQVSVADASPLGATVPKVLWLGLWVSYIYMILQPANRSPTSLGSMIVGMGSGEPGWIKSMDSNLGSALTGNGTEVTGVLVVLFALAGVGVFVPRLTRPAVVVAMVLGAAFWVAENFGGIFTGQGTDPNSGLLVMLLAAAYWPFLLTRAPQTSPAVTPATTAR